MNCTLIPTNIFRSKTKQATKKEQQEINRFKANTLSYCGCSLFAKFDRYHLNEQQRSSDALHSAFVQKLSCGEEITFDDLQQYKDITLEDILENPDLWKFAPILVSTNIERLIISRYKARLWALENKTHVFKWKRKLGNEINRPCSSTMKDLTEKMLSSGNSGWDVMLHAIYPTQLMEKWHWSMEHQ